MADIHNNQAAWQTEPKVRPLKLGSGPDQSKPKANEVIIEAAAVGINPVDCQLADSPFMPLEYPVILGYGDVAGKIVAVGPDVTRFKVGDKVMASSAGILHGSRHGVFQKFSAAYEPVVAKVPESIPFERAVALPVGITTSSIGLYKHLKLNLPTVRQGDTTSPKQTVLIWGGAGVVGSTSIQLATAAGYDVVTTASAKNFDYVKKLNASKTAKITIFDYADSGIAEKIISHIKNADTTFAGAWDCIGVENTTLACAAVIHAFGGGVLPSVLFPPKEGMPEDVNHVMVGGAYVVSEPDHPGIKLWSEYVPEALESGLLKPLPEAMVVGQGLDKIDEAMNTLKKGVSATKVVVTL